MTPLPTALLLHTHRTGRHFDWLMGDPRTAGDPDARLWTARTNLASGDWRAVQTFELTEAPPHRRVYLTYEGPISGDRGHVRRVDAGTVLAPLWADDRRILDVRMASFTGRLELRRASDDRWRARVLS